MLPLLRAGRMPDGPGGVSPARVVNVNSAGHQSSLGGHHNPQLDFDDLQSQQRYDPFLAYSRSKLANLLFSYELARRHGHELVVNALHPGVVRTDLGRLWPKLQVAAMQVFAISTTKAAPAVTALAVEPVSTQGGYYDRTKLTRSSPPSYELAAAERLWQITERITGTTWS
jgi:NAD(P)-dependent dehydrogenase (short-subunit alcohol dehydrogenase family)